MTIMKRAGVLLAAGAVFFAAQVLVPAAAEAHGRGRGRAGFHGRGFGYAPYFGFGFGSYWGPWSPWAYGGPYAFRPEGGIDMGFAMMAGFGALDLNVKPGSAEVWVDGRFVAEARELDGYPSFLWLQEGEHRVQIYKGGFLTFDERVGVQRGARQELKVRLEKGQAEPPGVRPQKTPTSSRS
jgi:hypothetical protein